VGALSQVGSSVATAGSSNFAVGVDPSGKFAYAVNQGSADITMFSLNSNGTLARFGSVAGRFSPGAIAFSRGSSPVSYTPRFAFTANDGSSDVSTFAIDSASGTLSLVGTPAATAGTGSFSIAADPAGRFLYVGNQDSNDVSAFKINPANGTLSAIGTPIAAGTNPDGITVDPSGRFVYTANVNSHNVSTFVINQTSGALSGGSVTSTGVGTPQPFSVAVDPSGKFLFAANHGSASVAAFLINAATGALTTVAGSPFALSGATNPFFITVSPSGKFVYVANRNSIDGSVPGSVSGFSISLTSGVLTEITGQGSPFPAGKGPRSIAIDPAAGKFVYVGNENDSTASAFAVNPTTGALTENITAGSPFDVGGAVRGITVDTSGRFVFVGRWFDNGVSPFAINSATGALSKIGSGPVPSGNGATTGMAPFGITTTGTIQ
jgi:6-phosphogluconolactonase (cycloisomerase 2 family)